MHFLFGVDEVGRGPLAGPVIAACAGPWSSNVAGLRDSKKVPKNSLGQIFTAICDQGPYGVGLCTPAEIDTLNIHHASLLAMERAKNHLWEQYSDWPIKLKNDDIGLVVDGCYVWPSLSDVSHCAIISGDTLIPCVMAASIIAKVTRDQRMRNMAKEFPGYGFERHKGYPTREHLEKLIDLGPTTQHRKSYGPVRRALHYKDH